MSSVEATSPFTSTREPAPNTMPFGLRRKTCPFDCSAPRICDGSCPTIRFSTALVAPCCTKRAVSPAPMLKPGQLMIVPGVFVMVSTLPRGSKVAPPRTTTPPSGIAHALPCAIEVANAARRSLPIFMDVPRSEREADSEMHAGAALRVQRSRVEDVRDIELRGDVATHRRAQSRAGAGDRSMRHLARERMVARDAAGVAEDERAAERARHRRAELRRVGLDARGDSLVARDLAAIEAAHGRHAAEAELLAR